MKDLLWSIGIMAAMILALFLPAWPCPSDCGPAPQLIEYTKLPGVTPAEAAKMIAWGESFPCEVCHQRRWVTLLWCIRSFGYGRRC